LARWLYKRLVTRYRQASEINEYHFMYSGIKQDSGLLGNKDAEITPQMARKKVTSALDELVDRDIIVPGYKVDTRKEGRKIIDMKYTINATSSFIRDQKAANKRFSDNQMQDVHANLTRLG
jgi:hypothetical protein